MKKLLLGILVLCFVACQSTEEQLMNRAEELCQYIPDHTLLDRSKDFLTPDFYAILDTMFYRLPEHEAMDHEWLYYFVTGNGGTIANYEVTAVDLLDDDHAVATILVHESWPEGVEGEDDNVDEMHLLYMERVNGEWLMSDFDGHKADCIRYIANNRKEEALREAIRTYLLREIAPQYRQAEFCVPTLMMVRETDTEVWGDFWVFWYEQSGDTLRIVSGGNHSGRMTIEEQDGKPVVTAFEQTVDGAGNDASARRIFGSYYDIYMNMHSNESVREAVRAEQLDEYVRNHR